MKRPLTYALVADGTSDQALVPVIRWTLRRLLPDTPLSFVAFMARRSKPVDEFVDKVVRDYQPDIAFVHRDAERASRPERRREIPTRQGVVAIVPVRMTEAWLLIDETAIRCAASNPRGRMPIRLPPLGSLEGIPDPKATLRELLIQASGQTGRRLQRFDRGAAVQRVADFIGSFEPLNRLPAFVAFQAELEDAIRPFQ
jgi:hypothetical protein